MIWTLTPIEREILKRDCERSSVQTPISGNTDAIVAVLKKGATR